jgi:hypothetical protein
LRGEQSPAHSDTGGPNPATTAEILAYLRQAFAMMYREIQATRLENLMDPVRGPYAGGNRFEVLTSALWHISNHYGQLVKYAHMNRVVPRPAASGGAQRRVQEKPYSILVSRRFIS